MKSNQKIDEKKPTRKMLVGLWREKQAALKAMREDYEIKLKRQRVTADMEIVNFKIRATKPVKEAAEEKQRILLRAKQSMDSKIESESTKMKEAIVKIKQDFETKKEAAICEYEQTKVEAQDVFAGVSIPVAERYNIDFNVLRDRLNAKYDLLSNEADKAICALRDEVDGLQSEPDKRLNDNVPTKKTAIEAQSQVDC